MSTPFHTVESLGDHRHMTPEGFLVVQDVPLARTGVQVYSDSEVPVQGRSGRVLVFRDPEEVFRPQTLASLQGKPVTLDHPEDDVVPTNYRDLAVGHVINPRQGAGRQTHLLMGDLLIWDQKAIDAINKGLRELSVGYEADYEDNGNGTGRQRNIVANHLALVQDGRCGAVCRIGDSALPREATRDACSCHRCAGATRDLEGTREEPIRLTLELVGWDGLEQFLDFWRYVRETAAVGHSFQVGADTDAEGTGRKEFGREMVGATFYVDGDGPARIERILLDDRDVTKAETHDGFEEREHPRGEGGKFTSAAAAEKAKPNAFGGATHRVDRVRSGPSSTEYKVNKRSGNDVHHVRLANETGEILSHQIYKAMARSIGVGGRTVHSTENERYLTPKESMRHAGVHAAIQAHIKASNKTGDGLPVLAPEKSQRRRVFVHYH